MTDVEGVPLINPYSQQQQQHQQQKQQHGTSSLSASASSSSSSLSSHLPAHHPAIIIQRLVCIGISIFGLHYFNTYQIILHSTLIRHEWFKIGLGSTIAFVLLKTYVEIFDGKILKKRVNYKEYKHTTHLSIFLICISAIAYNISLWPHFKYNTWIILSLFFYGIVMQLCLFIPTYIQNALALISLTFFLQQYK